MELLEYLVKLVCQGSLAHQVSKETEEKLVPQVSKDSLVMAVLVLEELQVLQEEGVYLDSREILDFKVMMAYLVLLELQDYLEI